MCHEFPDSEDRPAAHFFSYAFPSIIGMVLSSGIVLVDGLFVGRIVGEIGLAAVNLTMPVVYLFLGVSLMIGVGGAVKVSHALGAGNRGAANQEFSSTIAVAAVLVFALTIVSLLCFDLLLNFLHPNEILFRPVASYLKTILWFYPAMMMNLIFSIFIRIQGQPKLSLFFGVAGNSLNILLDYLMISRWALGLRGAALASGISVLLPMICGILYFLWGPSVLKLRVFPWEGRGLAQTLANGSSEMLGQLSVAITSWVFNRVILSRLGVDGVAAYTIAGYTAFFQIMILTGFSTGVAPIVGYCFGAGKTHYMRRIMKIALAAGFLAGLVCWLGVLLLSSRIASSFSAGNPSIIALGNSGFSLFTSAFLLNGFNILMTSYYTSIGDARSSALIVFLRGIVLINAFILLLPLFMGDRGIWISYPLAELVTCFVVIRMMIKSPQGCMKPGTSPLAEKEH